MRPCVLLTLLSFVLLGEAAPTHSYTWRWSGGHGYTDGYHGGHGYRKFGYLPQGGNPMRLVVRVKDSDGRTIFLRPADTKVTRRIVSGLVGAKDLSHVTGHSDVKSGIDNRRPTDYTFETRTVGADAGQRPMPRPASYMIPPRQTPSAGYLPPASKPKPSAGYLPPAPKSKPHTGYLPPAPETVNGIASIPLEMELPQAEDFSTVRDGSRSLDGGSFLQAPPRSPEKTAGVPLAVPPRGTTNLAGQRFPRPEVNEVIGGQRQGTEVSPPAGTDIRRNLSGRVDGSVFFGILPVVNDLQRSQTTERALPSAFISSRKGQCPFVDMTMCAAQVALNPESCSNDSRCPATERCCYNPCMAHSICSAVVP